MSAKTKTTRATSTNGKKNGKALRGKKSTSKKAKRQKAPGNIEEATMQAWEATYANRNKRFKI